MTLVGAMQTLWWRSLAECSGLFARLRGAVVLILVGAIAACGSTRIEYVPKPIELEEARRTIERLIMTQHQAFRPDDFVFTEDFFGWSFGTISRGNFGGVAVGSAVIGSSSERVRQLSDRVYYSQVAEVRLYSWKRKMRQWYVVSLIDRNNRVMMHSLRTLSREDAELMVDSLNQFLYSRNGQHPLVR